MYLATNYADLLGLQVFSWTIAVATQVVVAGTAGWYMRRVPLAPLSRLLTGSLT